MKKLYKLLPSLLFTLFIATILSFCVRGVYGNPDMSTLGTSYYKDEGPLELSPEKGRFALIYSLVENGSGQFSLPIAQFVTPDLGYKDGKFVSLFAPGVSFIAIPGYLAGKLINIAQVGSFAVVSLFALFNAVLIYIIAKQLKATKLASSIAALLFLFATPAFAYAVTLYQHHITVFFLLASLYLLIRWKGLLPLIFVWILVVGSVIIDYPNFFMFFPVGLYGLLRIFQFEKDETGMSVSIKFPGFLTFISVIIPIVFFMYTNMVSYDDPFQLSGTVETVKEIDKDGNPVFWEQTLGPAEQDPENIEYIPQEKNALGFFETRLALNGLNVHLFSSERGIFWYTPIILFGIIGMIILRKRNAMLTMLLISIIGVNLFLYSMWGDPWGGWAFGSRYLIPSYALMAIFTAIALTHFRKKLLFLLLFFVVLTYSIGVNTLGALTTNRIPPKGEAESLSQLSGHKEEYTYKRNWDYLNSTGSKSFVYQSIAKNYLTAKEYYFIIAGALVLFTGSQIVYMYIKAKKE